MMFSQSSRVVLALSLLASCLVGQCAGQLTYQTDANTNSFTLKTPGLEQSFTRIFGGQRGNLLQSQPLQQQQQYAPPASPQYQQPAQQYQQPQFQYQQPQPQQQQYQQQQQQYPTAQAYAQPLQHPFQQQFSSQQRQQQPQQGQPEQQLSIDQYQTQYYAYQQQQQQLQAQQQYQQQQQALQQSLANQQQQQQQQQHQQQQPATAQPPQLQNKPYYTEQEYAMYLQQQPLPQYYSSNISGASRFNGLQPTLPPQQQTFAPTAATYATSTVAPSAVAAYAPTTEANSKLLGVQYSPSDKVSHVKFSSGNLAYNF